PHTTTQWWRQHLELLRSRCRICRSCPRSRVSAISVSPLQAARGWALTPRTWKEISEITLAHRMAKASWCAMCSRIPRGQGRAEGRRCDHQHGRRENPQCRRASRKTDDEERREAGEAGLAAQPERVVIDCRA